VVDVDRVEFVADEGPIEALARVVDLVTRIAASHGFSVEARGASWIHWTRGFHNVVRAYAFADGPAGGVRFLWQGDVPAGLIEDVATAVSNETGWTRR
jgi:hypothetical protein